MTAEVTQAVVSSSFQISDYLALSALGISVITFFYSLLWKTLSFKVTPDFSITPAANPVTWDQEPSGCMRTYKVTVNLVFFCYGNQSTFVDCVTIKPIQKTTDEGEYEAWLEQEIKIAMEPCSIKKTSVSIEKSPALWTYTADFDDRLFECKIDMYTPKGSKYVLRMPITVTFDKRGDVIKINNTSSKFSIHSFSFCEHIKYWFKEKRGR